MPTGTNIEGSPCYAVHDKSSCFPFKWFEEGDKVEFLLTGLPSTNRRVRHS